MKQYFVYILASRRNGTLYIGMTDNLARRLSEHRVGASGSFTNKYSVHQLVHYEVYDKPTEAIQREKNLKAWQRAWKLRLIEETNTDWNDLSNTLFD